MQTSIRQYVDSDNTVSTVCLLCGWDETYSDVNLRGIKDPQTSHRAECCRHGEKCQEALEAKATMKHREEIFDP